MMFRLWAARSARLLSSRRPHDFAHFQKIIAVAAATCVASSADAADFVNVLTGGTSGVYPIDVALSQIYSMV